MITQFFQCYLLKRLFPPPPLNSVGTLVKSLTCGFMFGLWILFFVGGTRVWTQDLYHEPLYQPFFVIDFFRMGFCKLFTQAWLWTAILLISASSVAGITGLNYLDSHQILFHWSISLSLCQYAFLIALFWNQKPSPPTLFFFKIVLVILDSWHFQMNFQTSLSIFTESTWDFHTDYINCVAQFKECCYFDSVIFSSWS
jgi:hypothetical protein